MIRTAHERGRLCGCGNILYATASSVRYRHGAGNIIPIQLGSALGSNVFKKSNEGSPNYRVSSFCGTRRRDKLNCKAAISAGDDLHPVSSFC
jgi:hypothetical protein